ncbi:TetR/AcrR family transcriptional regulator [Blastococcus tunisiensis]|uniref:DNA-binding transcriptional regulator, AcrR family n=1 Tax=Blastococcus tunisiensis TaxID=1798228 RepID=A0A1I2GGX5_9ACTN|nr:TetR/AcrR family transcriptional regulator [Blastococcus sp. DSM 46838]SFF16772.1 DNA-binding transcriptional regulator, AcrR family [Blastococcus sp. DSM 46838]
MTASSRPGPPRLRRSAGDRRAQLVQIGLELLPTTPVQELTIDEVARRAGISRSLLFHYFANKREYYTAVTRAAADLLLDHLLPEPGTPAEQQVTGMLDRYVGWVETFPETYLAFVRGAGGGDPWVSEVYEETRGRLVQVALTTLDLPDDALRRQLVLAWFAFTEDLVGSWVQEPTVTRAELLDLLRDVLDRLVARG